MTVDRLDAVCKARGWLTVDEQLKPGPMDKFWGHAAVWTLEGLNEWCTMERAVYLRMKMSHDVGITTLTDQRYDEILGKLVMLHEFHANIRQVMGNESND